jgi:hypothetical protein
METIETAAYPLMDGGEATDLAPAAATPPDAIPFQYFENYDDSIRFDVYRVSEHPEILAAAERIWQELPPAKAKLRERRDALKCILCNLAVSIERQKCIAISRRAEHYGNRGRYGKLFMTHGIMVRLLDHLTDQGWICQQPGFNDRDGSGRHSRVTRFWATKKLGNLFYSLDPADDIRADYDELVILRNDAKVEIPYRDNRFTNLLRQDLATYNELALNSRIEYFPGFETLNLHVTSLIPEVTIPETTNTNHPILAREDPTNLTIPRIPGEPWDNATDPGHTITGAILCNRLLSSILVCIFSRGDETFRAGGRFYSKPLSAIAWKSLNQEERTTIAINGEPTVELDYHSLHPTMLYAEKGIQYDGDPYDTIVGGQRDDRRGFLKKLLLTLINAKDETAAVKAMRWEVTTLRGKLRLDRRGVAFLRAVDRYHPDWGELIRSARAAHQPIADQFCSDAGIRLMNRDAAMMREIIMHFTGQGILCLPVHDSVVIARRYEAELREVMERVYSAHNGGFRCRVDPE